MVQVTQLNYEAGKVYEVRVISLGLIRMKECYRVSYVVEPIVYYLSFNKSINSSF